MHYEEDEKKAKEEILSAVMEGVRHNFRFSKSPEELKLWYWHAFGALAGMRSCGFFSDNELDDERKRTGALYAFELELMNNSEK